MARFGVSRNPDGEGYLLDIQADLLNLESRRDEITAAIDLLFQGF